MKAKKQVATLLIALLSLTLSAQQKFKCDDAFNSFEIKVNAGDHISALAELTDLRKHCRGFNEKMYTHGAAMLNSEYESARDGKQKEQLANDLIALYGEQAQYYPLSGAAVKKTMLQYKLGLVEDEEVLKVLDAAYASNKTNFTNYNAIETYFLLYLKEYTENKEEIPAEQFIEKYGDISTHVRYSADKFQKEMAVLLRKQDTVVLTNTERMFLNTSEAEIESLSAVGENIDILASKHIGCDMLGKYYAKNYEANKGDLLWLDTMVNSLLNNKCYKVEVLEAAAKEIHKLQPSAQTAFNAGTIALKKNNIKEVAAYFEEAAQLEPDQKKKADIYYRIAAALKNSDKGAAKGFAVKAAQVNPSTGRPYIFLSELYSSASRDCGLSEFDQKALLWLSIETVKKAEIAEAKYKSTVASMIEGYTERLPSKKDIQAAGRKKGDKITYGCWINETVTIPNVK